MRKTHMKLGSLIVMTCLFLAAGMSIGVGTASAQHVQASKKFHHWFAQAPHITIKMLPSTAAHHANRLVISGVGFNACCTPVSSSNSSCDNACGSNATTSDACSNATCSSTTSQTTSTDTNSTTTTTTTTTTSPSTTTYSVSAPNNSTYPATTPSDNTYPTTPAPSTTCSNACGNSAPSVSYSTPAPSNTCPSYDPCGNSTPSTSDTSSTDCSCSNTVDLQSSAPLYAPGINLTRVPVNAFGEFHVTVNLQPRRIVTRHYTMPTIWAINSYNDQPSNYASTCCSYSACCQ